MIVTPPADSHDAQRRPFFRTVARELFCRKHRNARDAILTRPADIHVLPSSTWRRRADNAVIGAREPQMQGLFHAHQLLDGGTESKPPAFARIRGLDRNAGPNRRRGPVTRVSRGSGLVRVRCPAGDDQADAILPGVPPPRDRLPSNPWESLVAHRLPVPTSRFASRSRSWR